MWRHGKFLFQIFNANFNNRTYSYRFLLKEETIYSASALTDFLKSNALYVFLKDFIYLFFPGLSAVVSILYKTKEKIRWSHCYCSDSLYCILQRIFKYILKVIIIKDLKAIGKYDKNITKFFEDRWCCSNLISFCDKITDFPTK